ncbi:MAG TPA: hypothetical protein VN033_13470 [Vulgatibacter sp.]|nr:hypothetical protein [Vulgatibacter sp.]
MTTKWSLLAYVALIALATGCAGPRYVAASTGSKGQVKFLWTDGSDQGVVKCEVADNGDLNQCRNMNLVLED